MANICVVGAGYWGKNLLRTFDELGALYAVCDSNPATLRACEEPYPDARLYPALDKALENGAIDAVAVAAPAALHFELARQALEAGKHVFCEKPLALHASEGATLCRVAEERKRVLMVGHLLEFHPVVEALKALVLDGGLGEVWYAYSNRLKFGRFRTEEDVLWSFAPHDISILNAVLGAVPKNVSTYGSACLTDGLSDVALARFEYEGNLRSHVFVSWLNPFPERKFVVVGSERMAVFDDLAQGPKLHVFETAVSWDGTVPVARPLKGEPVDTSGPAPLLAECRHFVECVEKGSRPRTDGVSALRVLRVLEACRESMDKNGMVVPVSSSDE